MTVGAIVELGSFLATSSIGTQGTDLFLNGFDDTPDNQVTLRPTGGNPATRAMGNDNLIENETFQLAVRNTDSSAGLAKAEAAYDALQGKDGTITAAGESTARYLDTVCLQKPFLLNQDEDGRYVFAFNFLCIKDPSVATP